MAITGLGIRAFLLEFRDRLIDTELWAIGSHSRFQISKVFSTQSLGVQPTDLVAPAGSALTPSS